PIDFLSWPRIISADSPELDIVKRLSCGMNWLVALPSGGILLAPGLLKLMLVNTCQKPQAPAFTAPSKLRFTLFFCPLVVVTILLAFASWPAHSQGILVPRGSVWKYSDQGIDLGTAWRESGFGDGSWASGPARLGFSGDSEVIITVNDTNPPVLLSAIASPGQVTANYSKRVSAATATNLSHYSIDNGVMVSSADLGSSSNGVVLTTTPLSTGVTYTLTVNGIQDTASNTIAPNSQLTFSLVPYVTADVGGPGISGSVALSGGIFTLTGGGSDIGGTSDRFSFSYQQLSGDFDMRVRVLNLNPSDAWAKAGLMARVSLDAGSSFAAVLASPSLSGSFFEARALTNGTTSTIGNFPVNYPNTWLRLQRAANQFTGYASFDGQNWSLL